MSKIDDKPTTIQTKTVESGIFIRTKWVKNGKKHQRTLKIKQNKKKVVLGFIGDFELYAYPFDFPDKVFLGKFPNSVIIDSTNVNSLLGAYNKTKWFLSNQAFSKPTNRKGANMRRQQIINAYEIGRIEKTRPKQADLTPNYNLNKKKKRAGLNLNE